MKRFLAILAIMIATSVAYAADSVVAKSGAGVNGSESVQFMVPCT